MVTWCDRRRAGDVLADETSAAAWARIPRATASPVGVIWAVSVDAVAQSNQLSHWSGQTGPILYMIPPRLGARPAWPRRPKFYVPFDLNLKADSSPPSSAV